MEVYLSKSIKDIYDKLQSDAISLLNKDPIGNRNHPKVKWYEKTKKAMKDAIANPNDKSYLLGNTLGTGHRAWRRLKRDIPSRYRFFFRFFSETKEIFFIWMNDERHLRREGDRSDVYMDFTRRVESGEVPESRDGFLRDAVEFDLDDHGPDPPTIRT